jgi:ferredoxin-NADP reductase
LKRTAIIALGGAVVVTAALSATAQAPDSHAQHHPATPESPAAPAGSVPSQSSGCAGGMMGCMMRVPVKQLYPQLMELPAMTPEARARIEADARARINAGNAALAQAQQDYHRAMMSDDTAAMAAAMSRQRVAMSEMESGTAALRALAEGQSPRQIALTWFREQMNLGPAAVPAEESVGPFGLSWFHLISMAVVALFALTMLAFGIARHRRSIALVNQLTRTAPLAKGIAPATPFAPPAPVTLPPTPATPSTPALAPAPASVAKPGGGWSGTLRVASIVRETPHVKTFRLVDPAGGPIPFRFRPGQFLTFSAQMEGRTVSRSYTIASPPTRSAYVEVTVKREDEGDFSRFLHDKVSVGSSLKVRGPGGVFTFDGGNADSIVLIAGGVGITPMMCVIRYLTDQSWPGEIFLVFAMRSTEEFIFREELEYLQRRDPKLHVAATVDVRSEGTAWMGLEGPITKDALAHAVPGIEKRRVHLCGPPPMMEAVRRILSELGVPESQIKTEAFGPALGLVPPPRPLPPPPPPVAITRLLQKVEGAVPATSAPPQEVTGPATATISFARSGKTAPLPPDKSVLEVAESIGVPIDYSCRVGTCGICKTKLLAGQVTMQVQDALTDEDKASGIILACQAHSLGDLTVDA